MKRNIFIFSFFTAISISLLFISGCRLGDYDCQFHGLTSNKVINCPEWIGCISHKTCSLFKCTVCDCTVCDCGQDFSDMYGDGTDTTVDSSRFIKKEATIVNQHATNQYDDKYVTVKLEINFTGYEYTTAVSFKIKIYDNDVLVGQATTTRYNNFNRNDISVFGEGSYVGYYNIPIEKYIIGEYRIELENLIVCAG